MVENNLSEGVRWCAKEKGYFGENYTQEEESQNLLSDVEIHSDKMYGLVEREFDKCPYRYLNRKLESYNTYDCYDLKENEPSKYSERKKDVQEYIHAQLDNLEYIENAEIVLQTSLFFGLNLVIYLDTHWYY